jgi:hypothetical protein
MAWFYSENVRIAAAQYKQENPNSKYFDLKTIKEQIAATKEASAKSNRNSTPIVRRRDPKR